VPGFVNYKKGCTRLAATSDKVYQLLAHGRWFSLGTPASSTIKTGRHDIAEILLKVALNTINQIKSNTFVLSKLLFSVLERYFKKKESSTIFTKVGNPIVLCHSYCYSGSRNVWLLSNPIAPCHRFCSSVSRN
jgi:hypothetical protein